MNQIMIDGNIVKTEKDFHRTLAIQCDVTEFYGHNLDALWDLLSWGVERLHRSIDLLSNLGHQDYN
ncbi:barstar family protein [Moraxella ovis]|uniref:barstar family protein n=1 Tax=Moraxella ovis TaxID=29433 RepID=UPI00215D9947|nr:barstar family protein [Moraxella ovis]